MITQEPRKPTSFWQKIWRFLNTPISDLLPWLGKRRVEDGPKRLVAIEAPQEVEPSTEPARGTSPLSEIRTEKAPPVAITKDLSPIHTPTVAPVPPHSPPEIKPPAGGSPSTAEPLPEERLVVEVASSSLVTSLRKPIPSINFTLLEEAKAIALKKLSNSGSDFTAWRVETGYPPLLLIDLDLSGRSFNNVDWRNCVLTRVDFSNSDLKGSSFMDAVLYGCRFVGAEVESDALLGQSARELIGLSPFVLAQLLREDSASPWDEPVIPFQIRHEGKPWNEGEHLSQRVVIQNDSSVRLRFDIQVERNGHETRPIQRFLDPARETYIDITVEAAAQDSAQIIVRVFPPDKRECHCLNSWRMPFTVEFTDKKPILPISPRHRKRGKGEKRR